MTRNLYSAPTATAGTSTDQYPLLPSGKSGLAVADQALKSPATATPEANGAQTRKVVPVSYGVAPMKGLVEIGMWHLLG